MILQNPLSTVDMIFVGKLGTVRLLYVIANLLFKLPAMYLLKYWNKWSIDIGSIICCYISNYYCFLLQKRKLEG
ncbi:hypothetical protein [Romboutsia weinsteinii]|uniref:hypothetical protein n=1 Tax=Romboutsia weinsteinii TaxID=2020949 RepID=UPI001313E823|nr:hypothetical protein [Romboutsia weinsteinii]